MELAGLEPEANSALAARSENKQGRICGLVLPAIAATITASGAIPTLFVLLP